MKTIKDIYDEFKNGKEGNGIILWHKKLHKNESGDFACLMGIKENCANPVNCNDCYTNKTGGYCLIRGGENIGGFLVHEPKHKKFIEKKFPGAYNSISEAIRNQ